MHKSEVLAGHHGGWVIKCNPEVWDIRDSSLWDRARNEPISREGNFRLIDNYRAEVLAPGDPCFFYVSGDVTHKWEAGIWATCEILGDPYDAQGSGVAWRDLAKRNGVVPYVDLRWTFLPRPIPKVRARGHRPMGRSELFAAPQMSNPVALTDDEVAALDGLIATQP